MSASTRCRGSGCRSARAWTIRGSWPPIAAAGYRDVGWDVDGLDWEVGKTAAALEAAIVEGATRHGDGAIVLCHGWPDPTHEALPGIVARLRDAGAEFVRVDALIAV